jgi:hypothetical protein
MLSPRNDSGSSLGVGNLKDAVHDIASGLILVQTYTKTITTQPIITGLSELPNLADHQNTAISHANNWLMSIQPDIIQVQADIGAFADGFNTFYSPLLDLANKIAAGGGDQGQNVIKFNEGLSELQKQVADKQANVKRVSAELNSFQVDMGVDDRAFQSDYADAKNKILQVGGPLDLLNTQLTRDQADMAADVSKIALAAVGDVAGGLMICVGALAEIETAGLATVLIMGGLFVIGGSSAEMGLAIKDYIAKQHDYTNVSNQIAQINAEITVLTTVKGQLDSFTIALGKAITAMSSVDRAWDKINSSFKDLSEQLTNNINTASPFIVSEVTTAGTEWTDLKTLIANLETFHDIPTTPQTVAQATQTPPAQMQAA